MISYDIGLKLYKAGFPQRNEPLEPETEQNLIPSIPIVYLPTLSELIEECGDDFELVRRVFEWGTPKFLYWMAECTNTKGICARGDSAEEAVARLWLALKE